MEFLALPERTKKSRTFGLTSIADFGTPIGHIKNILSDYHHFIDIAKIGIGSAYITPNLEEKIHLYKQYDIIPYCGGTLFEKCFWQGKIKEYIGFLKRHDITWIEVSNGTLDIPIETRLKLVSELKKEFNVIAEVGSKDADKEMPVSQWKREIDLFLNAGCHYVITEGRDSGTAGIYERNGNVKGSFIEELIKEIDVKRVIFEAPTPKHQMYFINQIGANVNLGNVKLDDALVLETQRKGLRSETFFMEGIPECNSF